MSNSQKKNDKKALFDWKMIRIPRMVLRLSAIVFLVAMMVVALVYGIKYKGDQYPILAKIGTLLRIDSSYADKSEAEEENVMEARSAKLVYVKGDVTVKAKKELLFQKAVKGQILYEGDSIRTFSGGFAEVRFDEGNRLNIKPDSMVVIRTMKENRFTKMRKSSIKLRQSDVEAIVRRPKVEGSEFVIETPTALARISEAKVAMQVSKENKSNLKVFKGAVDLKVGDQSMEITQNQSVAISNENRIDEVKDLPSAPKLLDPKNLAEYYFKSLNQMQTVLKWSPVSQDVKYRLQAALDPYFSELVIVRTGLSQQGVVVQGLKSGIYYWRVSAINPDGLEGDASDYRVFKVVIDQKPPDINLDNVLLLKAGGHVNAQISGQTEPEASIKINGVTVAPDKTGRFKYILSHVTSDAEVSIIAEDRVGNRNVLKKTIEIQ